MNPSPLSKLNSDRLWAVLAFAALVVANAHLGLGVSDDQLTTLAYTVVAFVLGKSIRGTGLGSALERLVPLATEALEPGKRGLDPTETPYTRTD